MFFKNLHFTKEELMFGKNLVKKTAFALLMITVAGFITSCGSCGYYESRKWYTLGICTSDRPSDSIIK